jgi:hypothetical protein
MQSSRQMSSISNSTSGPFSNFKAVVGIGSRAAIDALLLHLLFHFVVGSFGWYPVQ